MPGCEKCGKQVAEGSRFCPSCGAAVLQGKLTVTSPTADAEPHVARESRAAPSSVHGRFEAGTRLGTRYRIVGLLGRGGMGEVYRADDLELGQSVALKFLPARVAADPSWLSRFRNEVRTARQVAHPNVCRIYDIAEEDGHVFLSMEYIDGEDLSGVLRRLGRPSREKAIEIARQICLGLAAAHESNVLHRDLKPANIMIDGRGRVRITDFGLAGFLDELEQSESRAGTPAYMAPEQLTDGKVSARSDIYSLGLILYELFTGKGVFDTNDIEELKRKHTSGTVATPSSVTEEIDPVVERVVMRCLEQQPEQRPQSVYQVLAALPGGDPLAAALAAGELPSPELVANARDAGGLRPPIAVVLLVGTLAFMATTYFVWTGTTVMPQRSPAELSVIAKQVMEEFGYDDLPRNTISGYDVNTRLSESLRSSPRPREELAELGWPPRFRFWRRWSQGDFQPREYHNPQIFRSDGQTTNWNGTATVALDSTGRLLGLHVGPSLSESSAPAGEMDWSPILRRANLNASELTEIPPLKRPSVDCDIVAAWRIEGLGEDGNPVTIQVGSAGGRPNYFEYIGLDAAMAQVGLSQSFVTTVSGNGYVRQVIFLFLLVLALRNLRASRGDRRNAIRCALVIGGLYAVLEMLSLPFGGRVSPRRVEEFLTHRAVGHVLLHSVEAWVMYMAVEPYVRRVWPRMLVGVVRLLSGRWRDPAVGREVLIGVVTACCLSAILALMSASELRIEAREVGQLPAWGELWTTMSPLHFMSMKAHRAAWTVLDGIFVAGLLIALRLLTRHTLAAVVLGVAVLGCWVYLWGFLGASVLSLWFLAAYSLIGSMAIVLLYTRVGILSGMVFVFFLVPHGLATTGFDVWSTPYAMAELAILLALAAYGFWVSLAGQALFKDALLTERPARA